MFLEISTYQDIVIKKFKTITWTEEEDVVRTLQKSGKKLQLTEF